MFCSQCGAKLPDNIRFCPNCGAAVEIPNVDFPQTPQNSIPDTPNSNPYYQQNQYNTMQQTGTQTAYSYEQTSSIPQQNTTPLFSNVQQSVPQAYQTASVSQTPEEYRRAQLRELIGKNAEYYMSEFDKLQRNESCRWNWASFFLGLYHSAYRNTWKEWIRRIIRPVILQIVSAVLAAVFAMQAIAHHGYIVLTVLLLAVFGGSIIWQLVTQILFAKNYNQIYYTYLQECLDGKRPRTVGTSGLRVFVCFCIIALLSGSGGKISTAIILSIGIGGLSSLSGLSSHQDSIRNTTHTTDGQDERFVSSSSVEDTDIETPVSPNIPTFASRDDVPDTVNAFISQYNTMMEYVNTLDGDMDSASAAKTVKAWGDKFDVLLNDIYQYLMNTLSSSEQTRLREEERTWVQQKTKEMASEAAGFSGQDADMLSQLVYLQRTAERCSYLLDIALGNAQIGDGSYYQNALYYADNWRSQSTYEDSASYLYPSDTQYITESEMQNWDANTARLVRNEIYARHGYIFQSEDLQNYFKQKSWYSPNSNFSESMFNTIEKANRDAITQYEQKRGWR